MVKRHESEIQKATKMNHAFQDTQKANHKESVSNFLQLREVCCDLP